MYAWWFIAQRSRLMGHGSWGSGTMGGRAGPPWPWAMCHEPWGAMRTIGSSQMARKSACVIQFGVLEASAFSNFKQQQQMQQIICLQAPVRGAKILRVFWGSLKVFPRGSPSARECSKRIEQNTFALSSTLSLPTSCLSKAYFPFLCYRLIACKQPMKNHMVSTTDLSRQIKFKNGRT